MISVIIPTCNRNDFLSRCLEKLKPQAQSATVEQYEVIVSDDSAAFVAADLICKNYSWVKWIEGPKKGPAANRNTGAKHANGEWLVFIDDDCIPDYNLITAYINAANTNKTVHVFEGYTTVEREQKNFMEESPINTTGGFLWSCNFMIEKNLFNNVLNGFDEQYPYASMEDVDLQYRIIKSGQHVQFLPDAKVIHPWRLQSQPFKVGKKRFDSLLYFINKFPEKKKDYNSGYFLKAFLRTGYGVIKNSFTYKFRGFTDRIGVTFLQLYFAFKIASFKNRTNDSL